MNEGERRGVVTKAHGLGFVISFAFCAYDTKNVQKMKVKALSLVLCMHMCALSFPFLLHTL